MIGWRMANHILLAAKADVIDRVKIERTSRPWKQWYASLIEESRHFHPSMRMGDVLLTIYYSMSWLNPYSTMLSLVPRRDVHHTSDVPISVHRRSSIRI